MAVGLILLVGPVDPGVCDGAEVLGVTAGDETIDVGGSDGSPVVVGRN